MAVDQKQSRFVASITPQSDDFPGWYNDVVLKAQLADYSPVRGCMVIRPYGYAIWESMRDELDRHIKRTGHENVYFPLFVPRSLLEKEAEHVEGFNPQVAWVTHAGGEELGEPLAIRPTSEAIIAEVVKDWIQSYRDLPLLYNLWNNVVRWELRTRLFLRTTEFLWQEAHTFHATEQEACRRGRDRARGVPRGERGVAGHPGHPRAQDGEREVPGRGLQRTSIEAMMRDRKALQAGTSHMLGQNFAHAAGIKFLDRDNSSEGAVRHVVGLLDPNGRRHDHGPRRRRRARPAAQRRADPARHRAHLPVRRGPAVRWPPRSTRLERSLADVQTASGPLRWKVDWREESPGFKFNHWELRGVPFRLEIGPRDVAAAARACSSGGSTATSRRSALIGLAAGAARAAGRLPGTALPARSRLPRREHALRRHLRRVQGDPREAKAAS